MNDKEQFVTALLTWIRLFTNRSMDDFLVSAREQGLSMAQIGPLMHLSRLGASGVSGIAEHLGVSSAAASQMLDRLVQSGLVNRTEDPQDRRAKQVILTARGREIIASVTAARSRWLEALAASLTTKEREQAILTFRLLRERAEKLDLPSSGPAYREGEADIAKKETTAK